MNCKNCGREIKEDGNYCVAYEAEILNNPEKVSGDKKNDGQDVKSKENKLRLARLLWVVVPIVSLLLLFLLWGLISLIETTIPTLGILAELLDVFVPILMVLTVIFVPIGIIVAIKISGEIKRLKIDSDLRSGQDEASVVPEEVKKGLNWGAGLGFIWGIYFNIWSSLLVLIPIPLVTLIWFMVALFKGNEWVWQKNKWASVEEFKESHRKWNIAGVIALILYLLLYLSLYLTVYLTL